MNQWIYWDYSQKDGRGLTCSIMVTKRQLRHRERPPGVGDDSQKLHSTLQVDPLKSCLQRPGVACIALRRVLPESCNFLSILWLVSLVSFLSLMSFPLPYCFNTEGLATTVPKNLSSSTPKLKALSRPRDWTQLEQNPKCVPSQLRSMQVNPTSESLGFFFLPSSLSDGCKFLSKEEQ